MMMLPNPGFEGRKKPKKPSSGVRDRVRVHVYLVFLPLKNLDFINRSIIFQIFLNESCFVLNSIRVVQGSEFVSDLIQRCRLKKIQGNLIA